MKVKVCGLNNPSNIMELTNAGVNFFGFIFYKKSPRYCAHMLDGAFIRDLHHSIKRVGVFVNADEYEIMEIAAQYYLDYVQLHGEESPEFCSRLNQHLSVIKAISIGNDLNKSYLNQYKDSCEYFLFDTKTKLRGGSGRKFDWRVLEDYTLDKPFFLSGGISLEDVEAIKEIQHPQLIGIDINSRFESVPGIKNVQVVKEFIQQIK